MIYETDRTYTREMNTNDIKSLSEILQDAEVMAAYEHAFSDEEVREWLDKQMRRYEEYDYGMWAVILKKTGEMIGQCGLSVQEVNGEKVLEIGYMLKRKYWHEGYATEAAAGCKRYAFEELDAEEVYSIVRDTNIASMNVAIRNKMTVRCRIIKNYYGIDMPHLAFSIRKVFP
ncbi:MAG: GNAT family N-acetyltransferase [Clostridiales bacterium]|jgi:RimJ/RimL family protein N-acetyltransferase|nr:GNAT family N-acetyltransferase [Clostridiales bacterium]